MLFPWSTTAGRPVSKCQEVMSALWENGGEKKAQKAHLESALRQDGSTLRSNPPPLSVKKAQKAVWRIGTSLAKKGSGTAVFISPNLALTNFHVLQGLSYLGEENIKLTQKNSWRTLRLNRVEHLSALEDLALISITSSVKNYLTIKEDEIDPQEIAYILGYPKGLFKISRTRGMFFPLQGALQFPIDNSVLKGISGAPLTNPHGEIIGLVSAGNRNMLIARSNHRLKNFIEERKLSTDKTDLDMKIIAEIERIKGLAIEGDFSAQYELAYIYFSYISHIEKFAEKGSVLAQNMLKSLKTEQSPSVFYLFIKSSAKSGHALAQYFLGEMYYNGEKVEKDLKQAYFWIKKSAEQGHIIAQSSLGKMYYWGGEGRGVEKDLNQARFWAEKASKQGYAPAQDFLSKLYFREEGEGQELNQARFRAEKAGKQGPY